jgi:peptidyl-prolyl isomerase D
MIELENIVQQLTGSDCGQLHGEEAAHAGDREADKNGDLYEDFPEDQADDFTGPEVLKIAGELKDLGNKLFKSGDRSLGLDKYQKGLRYLNEYRTPQENDAPELGKQLDSLRFTLHSNSALLQLKGQSYDEAKESATNALSLKGITDAEKAKGLYRRALGSIGLKDDEDATVDLLQAQKLAPSDAAIAKELEAVKTRQAEYQKKVKAVYSKAFA